MRPALLLVVLASLAACSSFGAANDTADGGPDGTTDGSIADATTSPDASSADAGACTTVIDDHFVTQAPEWNPVGDNQAFGTAELVLTPGGISKNGAVWWRTPISFDSFLRVHVEFTVSTIIGGMAGNGLAVGWVDTQRMPGLADLGQSFNICSTTLPVQGYAVVADTKNNKLLVIETAGCNVNPVGNRPAVVLGGSHSVTFEIRADGITGSFVGPNGKLAINRSNLVPPAPKTGYFGLTAAATTTVATAHVVKAVKVESCKGP